MTDRSLAVQSVGMVTGVGLNAWSTSAAIFAGLDNFEETRYMDKGGEWALASQVLLSGERGLAKHVVMLAMALQECLPSGAKASAPPMPLLLCLAEKERPGRLADLDDAVLWGIKHKTSLKFHRDSIVLAEGKVSGILALEYARELIYNKGHQQVLLAGVDSLLNIQSMAVYEANHRILTSKNSDGFIPGEGAAVLLLGKPTALRQQHLQVLSTGLGQEPATIHDDTPLRADGLAQAFKAALQAIDWQMHEVDFRICDINGEHYYFKEASLALSRVMRTVKEEFDIWDPVSSVGDIGAAMVPAMLAYLDYCGQKRFLPGHKILAHAGNDQGKRGACILSYSATK